MRAALAEAGSSQGEGVGAVGNVALANSWKESLGVSNAESHRSACVRIAWGSLKCSFPGSVGSQVGLQHLHSNRTSLSNSAAVPVEGSHLGGTAQALRGAQAPELPPSADLLLGSEGTEGPGF